MGFVDPNDFEQVALSVANDFGGMLITQEQIETIVNNKPRMVPLYSVPIVNWERRHWTMLVEAIVAGYIQSLQDQADEAMKALRKTQILPPVGAEEFPSFSTDRIE